MRLRHAADWDRIGDSGPPRANAFPCPPANADGAVSVLLLTVFVGAVLVLFFVAFFLHQATGRDASSERDALLPLAEEKPKLIPFDTPKP
jgi:hypothetical protein